MTFHNLVWSGSHLVKTAPHPHSTGILFQTCSHCFLCFPNHWVPTHFPGGCREGDHFCTDPKCHNSWHFESHQVVSKAWYLSHVCCEHWYVKPNSPGHNWLIYPNSHGPVIQTSIHQEELGSQFHPVYQDNPQNTCECLLFQLLDQILSNLVW